MLADAHELRAIHAEFGSAETLIRRRRATYSAALELVSPDGVDAASDDLLDSPVARAHLADVIRGVAIHAPERMVPIRTITGPDGEFVVGGERVRVAAGRAAQEALGGALVELARQLDGDGAAPIPLLRTDDPRWVVAKALIAEGLELATRMSPVLAHDLLPHVAAFAVVDAPDERLGSASIRQYPGLIVLPVPATPIEVAEAFIHEGAHQKLFDLCLTCSVLDEAAYRAPATRASWSDPARPPWPFEQCLAAFHAYTCLAAFESAMDASGEFDRLPESSLLPHARKRAAELGELLAERAELLGPAGRRLLAGMTGAASAPTERPSGVSVPMGSGGGTLVTRDCGDWTLLAQMDGIINLYWVQSATLDRSSLDHSRR